MRHGLDFAEDESFSLSLSLYIYIYVCIYMYVYICPQTASMCPHTASMCPDILGHMCPHTASVVCPHTASECVLLLLNVCPHTRSIRKIRSGSHNCRGRKRAQGHSSYGHGASGRHSGQPALPLFLLFLICKRRCFVCPEKGTKICVPHSCQPALPL